jgi:uncharacterized protein
MRTHARSLPAVVIRLNAGRRHVLLIALAVGVGAVLIIGRQRISEAAPPSTIAAPEKPWMKAGFVHKPAAWSDQSYYFAMHDGTRLAVSLYFPNHQVPAKPAPVLLLQTRYGRADSAPQGDAWLKSGYVVASVDVRGTTSSFGCRATELGPDEQRDMDEIIAHLAEGSWSNGKVIAEGRSYLADTADLATTRPAPALVAAIPRETDFDIYQLFWPGGIPNNYLFQGWGNEVYETDFGRDTVQGTLDCALRVEDCRKLFPMLQPVDEDGDYRMLQEAIRTRQNRCKHWSTKDYANALFRDDKGLNGYAIFEGSAGDRLAAVRRERKPVQYWGSWVDANTADESLDRYFSTPEVPSVIIITANDHSGEIRADPFFPGRREDPMPSLIEQDRLNLEFSDLIMSGRLPTRTIKYYVMGAGVMRETSVWPPAGIQQLRFALDAHGQLTRGEPAPGSDAREVDFTATAGTANRWTTQDGIAPAYTDRRVEDRKLLTYDTVPVTEDSELAGWAVVTLRMRTKTSDPAVFAYIEDVAPDGRVTYVTEGEIRAVDRKIADPSTLPYDQGPAPHSFNRAAALPVVPGEAFTLKFKLYSTATLIKKGHRMRLAIAGADSETFARLSKGQPEQFEIFRGGAEPSVVELPLRTWH